MLIRRAEVATVPSVRADVRIEGGRIAMVAEELSPGPGEASIDAAGGALLPGLHDHHLHLFALAAAQASVRCGPPDARSRDDLAAALRGARPVEGWIRGVGYHESVAGDLDRDGLDALVPDVPVRVQHRSGALWTVNSAGAERLRLDRGADAEGIEREASGRATGRLYHLDDWLRRQLGSGSPPSLAGVGRRLGACGVTGVTDATPHNGRAELEAFADAVEAGELQQRLVVMGTRGLPEPESPRIARGPVKLMLRETALPRLEALATAIAAAHAGGRCAAIHCVTRAELVLAIAAFSAAGARDGDRVEHASVAPPDAVALLADCGLTVVTQPNFLEERGDAYLANVERRDRPWLYRCRGFVDAGVALGAGTDAPFGDPDPWRAIRAAVERRTESGKAMGLEEALTPERALDLFTTPWSSPGGAPRHIEPGAPADLCLLDRPWREARDLLTSASVRATLVGGRVIWARDS